MRHRPSIALVASVALAFAQPAPSDPGPPEDTAPEVERLLRELASPHWSARELASARLLAFGPSVLPAVEGRCEDADLEIRWRAQRIACQLIDDGPPALGAARIVATREHAWMAEAWRLLVGRRIRGETPDRQRLAAVGVEPLRELEAKAMIAPTSRRIGHRALGAELGRALLREPLARGGDDGLCILRKQRRAGPVWPTLLHDAACDGSLRGQALEDAYDVLLTEGIAFGTPVELSVFGDEHGARVALAVLARLAGARNAGELATSWNVAIEHAARREAQSTWARGLYTARRAEKARELVQIRRERGLQELEELRRGPGCAEMALLAVGLELRDVLREAEGLLADPAATTAEDEPRGPRPFEGVFTHLAARADLSATERACARALARRAYAPRHRMTAALEAARADSWRAAACRHFNEERSLDDLREALLLAAIRGGAFSAYDKRRR